MLEDEDAVQNVGLVAEQNPLNYMAPAKFAQERTAELCAAPVVEKWVGRLGGVDTAAFGHAVKMVSALEVDYGVS